MDDGCSENAEDHAEARTYSTNESNTSVRVLGCQVSGHRSYNFKIKSRFFFSQKGKCDDYMKLKIKYLPVLKIK